jgi:putative phage-type endonuclease
MRKILDKRKMTQADWQAYREQQSGIGGSEAATILGLNPYKSKFNLWLEKTGQIERPKVNNQYIEWGNLLEPVIRKKFAEETGFKVMQNNFVLAHDIHDWMVANLDGEVIDPSFSGRGVLEIKTTSEHNKKEWADGCPTHYMCQLQHYLAVTGYDYAYIVCLCGGNHFIYYLVERDDYVIDQIIRAEMDFMDKVATRTPPEIGGSASESQWLEESFPQAIDEEMSISPYLEDLAQEYMQIQAEIKNLSARTDEIKNKIRLEGKEFKMLKGESVKISMPTINKVTFDSKLFAEEHPDLYAQYKTKQSSYRGFTVSVVK